MSGMNLLAKARVAAHHLEESLLKSMKDLLIGSQTMRDTSSPEKVFTRARLRKAKAWIMQDFIGKG
jgi:hypothetical protein